MTLRNVAFSKNQRKRETDKQNDFDAKVDEIMNDRLEAGEVLSMLMELQEENEKLRKEKKVNDRYMLSVSETIQEYSSKDDFAGFWDRQEEIESKLSEED